MQIGNQYRLYPTKDQAEILLGWIGCQRFIYNSKVSEDRYFRKFQKSALSLTGQYAPIDQQYSQFKDDELTPWLDQVPSQILRNGAVLWKQAYSRFFAKLAGRPVIQKRHGKQSVWLTSELYHFGLVTDKDGVVTGHSLHIGTKTHPIGVIKFKSHRFFTKLPNSIHISVHEGRWHVSFSYDDDAIEPTPEEIAYELSKFTPEQLLDKTVGLDRNVKLNVTTSEREAFFYSISQQKKLKAEEKRKNKWLRKMARRVKGSKNHAKARKKVARYSRYAGNVRKDFAHKVSRQLVDDPRHLLIVLEALQVRNMTKKAKAKKDENGKWLRNGAAAKSGLNKAILNSAWGLIRMFLKYKALRARKYVLETAPNHTSQKCSKCGHVHPDNRPTQAEFVCQACGHTDHADFNAPVNIKHQGVRDFFEKGHVQKVKKRCAVTKRGKSRKNTRKKQQVGAVGSEPAKFLPMLWVPTEPTSAEITVSREVGNDFTLRSLKQKPSSITQKV